MFVYILRAKPHLSRPRSIPHKHCFCDATSAAQNRQWEEQIDEIIKKEIVLEENMKTLDSIIWGQVSDVLWHRIQALDNFKTMNSESDAIGLLIALQNQAFIFQS